MVESLALALSIFVSVSAWSAPIKVMNFNTMCEFCGKKKDYGSFHDRLKNIADTIRRHDPDLASLQEFQTRHQFMKTNRRLGDKYYTFFAKGFLLSYPDPVLFVRKSRFEVLDHGGAWLAYRKLSIPRRYQWVKLRDRKDGTVFMFVGTHIDNGYKNKSVVAPWMNRYLLSQSIPVIFAGDTNLDAIHPSYPDLVHGLRNTFDEAKNIEVFANAPTAVSDQCENDELDVGWPDCRIDHVLVNQGAPWKVKFFGTDVYRYGKKHAFVSDHRAVVVELE